jgi:hypothetical protein
MSQDNSWLTAARSHLYSRGGRDISPRHYVDDRLWCLVAILLNVHRTNLFFFFQGLKLTTHIHLVPSYRLYLHVSCMFALCGAQSQGNFSEESYLN